MWPFVWADFAVKPRELCCRTWHGFGASVPGVSIVSRPQELNEQARVGAQEPAFSTSTIDTDESGVTLSKIDFGTWWVEAICP